MYLRLEIEGEESFHSFPDKDRVTIGRAPTCDIQVMADGISRYHLEVQEKVGGEFYAVDKGSTHGSFINEEQLEKDSPVALNTFFPARLGANVFVYLMDESVTTEEVEQVQESTSTESSLDNFFEQESISTPEEPLPPPPKASETFSLDPPTSAAPKKKKPHIHVPSTAGTMTKDRQKLMSKSGSVSATSKTATSRKVRRKKVATKKGAKTAGKKKKRPKKKEGNQKFITIILILGLLGFVGYKQWQKMEAKKLAKIRQEQEKQALIAAELKKQEEEKAKRLKEKLALEAKKKRAEFIKKVIDKDKCLVDLEIAFCNIMKKSSQRSYKEGAFKELSTMFIIVDPSILREKNKNLAYRQTQYELVFKEAQIMLGRLFHAGKFQKRQDMRLEEPLKNTEFYNLYALADFIFTFQSGLPDITKLEQLIIISSENGEYKSHEIYDIKKLKEANLQDHYFAAHIAYRSNILSQLRVIAKKYKYVPKKTKKEL